MVNIQDDLSPANKVGLGVLISATPRVFFEWLTEKLFLGVFFSYLGYVGDLLVVYRIGLCGTSTTLPTTFGRCFLSVCERQSLVQRM